jgi:transcriptional regulator with XRE-family HTH domain
MKNYGKRLEIARKYAQLSQAALAEKSGTSQANISKLELGNASGSEFTAQFADACNINPVWLATGNGEMFQEYTVPEKFIKHLKVLQELPDYAQDEVIRDAIKTDELIKRAQEHKKGNGTEK